MPKSGSRANTSKQEMAGTGRARAPSAAASSSTYADDYDYQYDDENTAAGRSGRETWHPPRRAESTPPGNKRRKFQFTATPPEIARLRGHLHPAPEDDYPERGRQLRRSPRIRGERVEGEGADAPITPESDGNNSPEGPTGRYQQIGEETPATRARWNDAMEIRLCRMWEEEEHLYNAAMDDHRRVDRRRDAIRRIAAHLELEGK